MAETPAIIEVALNGQSSKGQNPTCRRVAPRRSQPTRCCVSRAAPASWADVQERYQHLRILARDPALRIGFVDPGAVNLGGAAERILDLARPAPAH